MWHIYTMEYYSAAKRNEILPCVTWMDLEMIIRREDVGVGCALISCEKTKSQLAAEQPWKGECWIPPKKDIPSPRGKEKPQQDGRMGATVFKIKSHTHQKCLKGANKTLCTPGPRERSSDPTRDGARPACECFRVCCGGTGQQRPAVGTGALAAAVLGGACGVSPLGGGCH